MGASTLARWSLRERAAAARTRTDFLFSLISEDAFWMRPISLRHPLCFYRGHIPAFWINTLVRKALGRNGINDQMEKLFERGIDPLDERSRKGMTIERWPSRHAIEDYAASALSKIENALAEADPDDRRADSPFAAAMTCFEHELMHQETLLYLIHQLPFSEKRPPDGYAPRISGVDRGVRRVRIPAGRVTLGASPGEILFGWDNEFGRDVVHVPEFEMDLFNVTNARYLEFVESGGYLDSGLWEPEDWRWREEAGLSHPVFWVRRGASWMWRAMFEEIELPLNWPVYVSLAEARAFARWSRMRLPTETEVHRASYGTESGEEAPFPWGDEPPGTSHGNFGFRSLDPVPVGSFPLGASHWGIEDLVGNGWEWTCTPFAPFPGFVPMPTYPQYSADFFDGQHFVMKGASPFTDEALLRRSFRNWFQARYPYPYAGFRCVKTP